MPCLSSSDAAAPAPSCAALLIPCPRCTDGISTTNDPSSPRHCPECDGDGARELCCDLCGEYGASEIVDDRPFHAECAEEWSADALSMAED